MFRRTKSPPAHGLCCEPMRERLPDKEATARPCQGASFSFDPSGGVADYALMREG